MDFAPSPRAETLRAQVARFFEAELLPRHREWQGHVVERRQPAPFMAALREAARAAGLWNLALPGLADTEPGTRCSNLEFAPLAEIMGRLPWGSEPFNCHAPDVPNMVLLQEAASPEQKRRWLVPLLEGKTRSAFAMTEPGVASSDATNIATTIRRAGAKYVINGRKWYITGAAHPECTILLVLGQQVNDAPGERGRTQRHSVVIVPMAAAGVRLVRPLRFIGWEDHVAPVGELELTDVEVPVENLIGEEGHGFAATQARLGPARIHHCMRLLGAAEVMVELMIARARERQTFGRTVIEYDSVQQAIALSRIEIEQARLLVLKSAWTIDSAGFKGGWRELSLAKIAVPAAVQRIADRALQIFGAMGGSDDTPIHHALAYARLMRIGDGPDEVHLRQIFRTEPQPAWSIAASPYISAPAP
ncbi:MAG: acyl-CoA dehydrogenase family protein [Hyphomicrobiaceae bacterium]|nr:acyl-CoA dehydrogenase family protein [Hyphomicrobiaceae bacterium]